jgi:hypothetical protein
MAKLYRPHIPLKVRLKVIKRQVAQRAGDGMLLAIETTARRSNAKNPGFIPTDAIYLGALLVAFAEIIGCEVSELRLDHDPALGARKKTGEGKRTVYDPPANDPDHLFYRPHGAQHEGSHDVKTRIRGDHGQYSDIVLIKRQRRRERAEKPIDELSEKYGITRKKAIKPKVKWAKRAFPQGRGFQGRK